MRGNWGQQLLFTIDQPGCVESRDFKSMPMRDCVRRTGLDTIAAKNAAVVIDVIDLGVALGAADAVAGRVLRSLNVYAVGRTGGSAQEACYTLLQSILVALQH